MTYSEAKALSAKLSELLKELSIKLDSFPKGPMNLTPDHIKSSPAYRQVWEQSNRAFKAYREVNAYISKNFKKERLADRKYA